MDFPVRSGIVDGIYTVVLEIFVINLLIGFVKGITRLLGTRRANKDGRFRVISTRWTNVLGRGTSASGHLLRLVFYAVGALSITLIKLGTNGFTQIENATKEVIYVTQTDDVNAQYELATNAVMSKSANWAFASRLQWCSRLDADGVHVYSAFCDTKLCMDGLNNDDVQVAEEYSQLLDHFEENGRCNDGSDAPQLQLSPDIEITSEGRRLPLIEYRGGFEISLDWQNASVSDKFRLYLATGEQPGTDTENTQYVVAAKAFYEDFSIECYTLLEILEEDLVRVVMPVDAKISSWPEGLEWSSLKDGHFLDQLGPISGLQSIDQISPDGWTVPAFESFDLRVNNRNVLIPAIEKWLQTSTILSLTEEFRQNTWQTLTMVNLKVVQGVLPTEIVETQATRISALSIVGFGVVLATAILLLLTLITCAILIKVRSYEAVNLALNDREIYGLLKNKANHLGDASTTKANRLKLGTSAKLHRWGVISETDF